MGVVSGRTPYADLNAVLDDFVQSLRRILGDDFVGAYLQGSFAVGDADEHSDVDFIVATRGDVTDAEREALQAMHQRIYARETPWAQHLEGSYVPVGVLRAVSSERRSLVYLDNGATTLELDPHCDTAVVRWSLREHGVVLAGPDPRELVDPVPPELLRAEAHDALAEYLAWARESQERFEAACGGAPAMSRWKQPYLVLTFCRILHTLAEGHVGSKRVAGEWALRALDSEWSPLIRQALDDRPEPWKRVHQPARREVIDRTLEFAAYASRKAATLEA
jgi:predicted nucleotidyltransferase